MTPLPARPPRGAVSFKRLLDARIAAASTPTNYTY